jgi:putative DNA primase/helicase
VLCEGFATGLSVQKALAHAKIQAQVVICFSAHNMALIAKTEPPLLVIADNDKSGTGQRIADTIGANYWISETVGNDFNDDHLKRGDFAMMMDLKRILTRNVMAIR